LPAHQSIDVPLGSDGLDSEPKERSNLPTAHEISETELASIDAKYLTIVLQ
jgi:hypothetical protein